MARRMVWVCDRCGKAHETDIAVDAPDGFVQVTMRAEGKREKTRHTLLCDNCWDDIAPSKDTNLDMPRPME